MIVCGTVLLASYWLNLAHLTSDKNLLFNGVSIEKLKLCVNQKMIARYGAAHDVTFWRKLRDGNHEENTGKLYAR